MNKKIKFRIAFLGVTALAILMEIIAAFDGKPDTEPWTVLITNYIPSWITYIFFTGIFVWLIFHFRNWYKKRKI